MLEDLELRAHREKEVKIAVSGKGGVGKTFVAGVLADFFVGFV